MLPIYRPRGMDGLVDCARPGIRTQARQNPGARNQAARDRIHLTTLTDRRCNRSVTKQKPEYYMLLITFGLQAEYDLAPPCMICMIGIVNDLYLQYACC